MFIQHCIKGVSGGTAGITDNVAQAMLLEDGIHCNWWRNTKDISAAQRRERLVAANLNRHIHDYDAFKAETPFISLTAGCVSRDVAASINRLHEAEDIALRFATDYGLNTGYLFYCWVIVGLKPAVAVEALAEEVRELNTYMSWSDYQLEGEITAKLHIPANQIGACAKWEPVPGKAGELRLARIAFNPKFDPPEMASNIRNLIGWS